MLKDLPEVLSPEQYAKVTGGNAQATRYMCQRGHIPAVKVGKRWLIPRDLLFGKLIEMEEAECAKK